MAASGTTENRFRARTSTLTLLLVAGSTDRADLLELLEGALSGGLLGISSGGLAEAGELVEYGYEELDEDELDEHEDYDEEEYEEDAEEYYDDAEEDESPFEPLPSALLESQSLLEPPTQMQATPKGVEFVFVASVLERWLDRRPAGPLTLGPDAAPAIAPLVCCWSATITHALAPQPLTLPELHRTVAILDYETVEEHIAAMEAAGQVEPRSVGGQTYYALTDWMREGIAPIIAGARFESHYPEDDVAPPDILDVEAAFQLSLPLLKLPSDLRGSCRLGVRIPGEDPPLIAGATADVDRGRVVSSSALLEQEPAVWATGSPQDWMDTVVDPATARVKAGGNTRLAGSLLQSLHETLFGIPSP